MRPVNGGRRYNAASVIFPRARAWTARHLVLVLLIVLMLGRTHGQGPAPTPITPGPPAPAASPAAAMPKTSPAPELTKADLEPFLDSLIPSQLRNRNIAGAVVSAVKDRQVLLAKGYGYADYKERKPVIADQTLFRPGSISKLFVATAVMQLVEQGKLDLDRDIKEYIDFSITRKYPEPITLRHLLTHTAGFEETLKNLFVPSTNEMRTLREWLTTAAPQQIFPPGKIPSYSNYGMSIAGYIVERISGEPFEKYLTAHIFQPLGMEHSTFEQPLPDALAPAMSNGYLAANKPPKPFEFVQAAPAGALTTTATDMTRFMLAILQEGTVGTATILKPESVRMMQSRIFEVHPALQAQGLGFMDYSANNQRMSGHGGDTIYFHSNLFLMPEARFGFYIAYNSAGSKPGGGRGEVMRAILDRYFPYDHSEVKSVDVAQAQTDGRAVTGVYEVTRRSDTTMLKIGALMGQIAVKSDQDGLITVEGFKNQRDELKQWREIGPLVYNEIDGPDKLAFRRNPSGLVTELLPEPPIFQGQRVKWFENKKLILPAVGGSLGLLGLTFLLWPVAALVRRHHRHPLFVQGRGGILFMISRVVCFITLAPLVVLAIPLSKINEDISFLGDAMNGPLQIAHQLGWAAVVGALFLVFAAFWFWRTREHGWWLPVHATLLAVASIIYNLFAWHWHLLDASLKF